MSPTAEPTETASSAIPTWVSHGAVALLGLTLVHLIVDTFASSVQPLWPDLEVHLALRPGRIQLAYLLWNLAMSAGQLIFGFLGDRYRLGWLLWAGPLLGVVGMGAIGASSSFLGLGLLVFCGGLGVAAFHPEAAATAGSLLPHNRSRAMSVFATGGFIGQAFGPLSSGWVSERFGLAAIVWNIAWGLPMVLLFIPILSGMTRRGDVQAHQGGNGLSVPELLKASGGRLAVLVGAGILRVLPAAGTPFALASLLNSREYGNDYVGIVEAAFLFGIGLGGVACAVVVHPARERRVLWALPMLLSPLLLLCPALGTWTMPICTGVMGLLVGLGLPVYISYGQQLIPEGRRVASSIAMGVTWGLGGSIAAGLMALFKQHPEDAFLAFALGSLAAGFACLRLPRVRESRA